MFKFLAGMATAIGALFAGQWCFNKGYDECKKDMADKKAKGSK